MAPETSTAVAKSQEAEDRPLDAPTSEHYDHSKLGSFQFERVLEGARRKRTSFSSDSLTKACFNCSGMEVDADAKEGRIDISSLPADELGNILRSALSTRGTAYYKSLMRRIELFHDASGAFLKYLSDPAVDNKAVLRDITPKLISLIRFIRKDHELAPLPSMGKSEGRQEFNSVTGDMLDFLQSIKDKPDVNTNELEVLENFFNSNIIGFADYKIQKRAVCGVTVDGKYMDLPLDGLLNVTSTKAFLFDIDDVIIASEKAHVESWKDAMRTFVTEAATRVDTLEGIDVRTSVDFKKIERVMEKSSECIELIFGKNISEEEYSLLPPEKQAKVNKMYDLIPDLYKILKDEGLVPKYIDEAGRTAPITEDQLDEIFKNLRMDFMVREASKPDGEVRLSPNARELLIELHKRGIPCGFCTSTPKELSLAILTPLFERAEREAGDGYTLDVLLPIKTFGNEVPQGTGKPKTDIWHLGFARLNDYVGGWLKKEDIAIVEDNLRASEAIRDEDQFGAVVLLDLGNRRFSLDEIVAIDSGEPRKNTHVVILKDLNYIYLPEPVGAEYALGS